MKYLHICFFLFFTCLLSAQEAYYDSIAQVVMYMEDEEEGKLEMLYDLIGGYADKPNNVIEYGQQTLELAQSLGDKEKIVQTNFAIGKAHNQQRKYKEAISFFNEAITNVEDTIKSENILKDIYAEKGTAHLALKEYAAARNNLQKALIIFTKKRSRKDAVIMETLIGEAFLGMEDLDRAIVYFKKAERTYDKLKSPVDVVRAMCRTGMVYLENGDDNLALNQFKKALTRAERSGKEEALAISKKHLGKFYYSKDFFRESYDWQADALIHFENINDTLGQADMLAEAGLTFIQFDSLAGGFNNEIEALSLFRQVNNTSKIAQSLNRLGKYYIEIIGTKQAIKHLNEAIELNQEDNLTPANADCYLQLGYIHFQEKEFRKVVPNANFSLDLATQTNERETMQKAALLLSEAYYETKNYKKALQSRELFDSLYVSFSQAQLEKITNQKEKTNSKYENIVSEHRSASVYKYLFWILLPFLLAALGLFYIFYNKVNETPFTTSKSAEPETQPEINFPTTEKIETTEEKDIEVITEIQTVEVPTFDFEQQLFLAQEFAQVQFLKDGSISNEVSKEAFRILAQSKDEANISIEKLAKGILDFTRSQHLNSSSIVEFEIKSEHNIPQNQALMFTRTLSELFSHIVHYAFNHQFKGKINFQTNQKEDLLSVKITHNGSKLSDHFSKERGNSLKVIHMLVNQMNSQLEMKEWKATTSFSFMFNVNKS